MSERIMGKKIYTITCHEVYNHGASLQEYALLEHLRSLGHSAETLHYKPYYLAGGNDLRLVPTRYNKPIIKSLYRFAKRNILDAKARRMVAFDRFAEKYIPTHKTLYTTNDELKSNLPMADAYICGSDQIWNSYFKNGWDLAFYLNFVPDEKLKISYAASFAIDKLSEEVKPLVKENVTRLQAVGVRETSAVRILNELGIHNAVQVLDPVFLLDQAHYTSKFVTPITDEPFLFVYDFDLNPIVKSIALHLKQKYGWKIYTVNYNVDYADRNFYEDGPEKFVSLLNSSQFNITNSFHALVFSLIFNKQFAVVNRNEEINTRMRDLLHLFDIQDNLISSMEDFLANQPVDYNQVNPLLTKEIDKAKSFLHNSLK